MLSSVGRLPVIGHRSLAVAVFMLFSTFGRFDGAVESVFFIATFCLIRSSVIGHRPFFVCTQFVLRRGGVGVGGGGYGHEYFICIQ